MDLREKQCRGKGQRNVEEKDKEMKYIKMILIGRANIWIKKSQKKKEYKKKYQKL